MDCGSVFRNRSIQNFKKLGASKVQGAIHDHALFPRSGPGEIRLHYDPRTWDEDKSSIGIKLAALLITLSKVRKIALQDDRSSF